MTTKAESEVERQDTLHAILEAIDSTEVEPDRLLSIQLDKTLREAIRAAQASGKEAGVTLNVKVKVRADDPRRANFSATVNAKLPRPPVSGVSLYADDLGGVHRSDPAQHKLPFSPTNALFSRKDD